jgi:hypothetical protein
MEGGELKEAGTKKKKRRGWFVDGRKTSEPALPKVTFFFVSGKWKSGENGHEADEQTNSFLEGTKKVATDWMEGGREGGARAKTGSVWLGGGEKQRVGTEKPEKRTRREPCTLSVWQLSGRAVRSENCCCVLFVEQVFFLFFFLIGPFFFFFLRICNFYRVG